MRLLVSCVPYDGGKSGISVYVREVVAALAAQGHELTLLCEPGEELRLGRETLDDRRGKTSRLASDVPCQIPSISAPRWTRRPALSMLWHLFVLPFWIRRHRGDFDGFFICAANRRVCAFYPLPTAATVHDLANFHIPGKYSRLRMFYLAHVLPHYAKKAQHLVGLSGRETLDARREGDSRPASRASRPGSLLYISRIEHPGKNHVRLIEAYSRLPRETAAAHPLVIAGSDWKDAEIVHEAAKRSPNAAFIRFTGFVTGEKLAEVWAEAGFYVFPSLFEGFGLSLIEAMAQGIPCACSNNGSLGEIAGDVALTFDPGSVDEIAAALARLIGEDAAEREARIKRGFEWIKRFSWEDHAKGIVELIGGTLRHETMDEGRGRPARLASRVSCQEVSRLFGISVAKVTQSEAVERIVAMAKDWHAACDTTQPPNHLTKFVATLNVDFVANAVSGWPFGGNDELWGYLKDADLVTADGMPIVALSRLLRQPLPERVTGADMVPAILRRCAEEGLSVYVLGGDRDAVEEAFEKSGCLGREMSDGRREESSRPASDVSSQKQPLRIAGIDPAFVKLDEPQPEIVERINAAKPDILFVALGNPKQELWMGRNKAKLDVGAMIGVGGTFNFLAGRVKRAPRWMQKSGLEWVYRIVQEPGRLWRRYAYGLVKYSWLSFRSLIGGYR